MRDSWATKKLWAAKRAFQLPFNKHREAHYPFVTLENEPQSVRFNQWQTPSCGLQYPLSVLHVTSFTTWNGSEPIHQTRCHLLRWRTDGFGNWQSWNGADFHSVVKASHSYTISLAHAPTTALCTAHPENIERFRVEKKTQPTDTLLVVSPLRASVPPPESEDDTRVARGRFRSTVGIPKGWQGWRSVGNWRRPGVSGPSPVERERCAHKVAGSLWPSQECSCDSRTLWCAASASFSFFLLFSFSFSCDKNTQATGCGEPVQTHGWISWGGTNHRQLESQWRT